jgi:hypothetical protein
MPIHIDFFHPGRLVIIVARGVVTNDDLASSFRQLIESGALHYRKIIDISSPSNPMSAEDIEGTAARFRSLPNAAARGPIAFVVGPGRAAENAMRFAALTECERPVRVFHSLHEARKWLEQQPVGVPVPGAPKPSGP